MYLYSIIRYQQQKIMIDLVLTCMINVGNLMHSYILMKNNYVQNMYAYVNNKLYRKKCKIFYKLTLRL